MWFMKQADLGLNLTTKRTRKREFLEQMERVVPWAELTELIAPYAPEGKRGRPPFSVATMLRIHFMQQWFTLSDPAMEEALHDPPLLREFAALSWGTRLPDETTIPPVAGRWGARFSHSTKLPEDAEATEVICWKGAQSQMCMDEPVNDDCNGPYGKGSGLGTNTVICPGSSNANPRTVEVRVKYKMASLVCSEVPWPSKHR